MLLKSACEDLALYQRNSDHLKHIDAIRTMAPTGKATRRSGKAEIRASDRNNRRTRRKRKETFSIYIYKVLKQVHEQLGISSKAMMVMNSFVNDLFERLANEASKLSHIAKRSTISTREIQTALRLLLPGDLVKHAVSEGTKAVNKYTSSR